MIDQYFTDYIQAISSKFTHEETSEIGYRTDFEILLKRVFEAIKISRFDNDPKAKEGNKPDFVVVKNEVPLLYIETKDIGVSLDKVEKSEQMSRYYGYTNLILTDYVEFRFYRNGEPYGKPIIIADYNIKNRIIAPRPESYEYLARTLLDFIKSHKEPIKSGKHLAKIMGGKAQRIRDNIRQFFSIESGKDSDLAHLYQALQKLLVHDLTRKTFADMYAQTLVYGLFVARFYDKSLGGFSRQEARELIPNSNPLLRHFFDHIVGADFDTRLKYIVDELCEVFSHANVEELMKEYFKIDLWGKTHRGPDPVIHFYEDFLNEYDPVLRKKMGAYYTPLPVVEFIVHSIDYLLKKEFGLTAGLADVSKTKDDLHKVQILDPACGTGTFISSVIRTIYMQLRDSGQKGRWPAYVHHDLLPRLYGFELMMAPYTIAHLKLGIAFRQTGFWDFHRRLGIYLTNSLEESSIQQQGLFTIGLAESIAEESKEASKIKNEKPIMVVLGNPPYSVSSSNKGEWINNLIKVYKDNLDERNIQPLSDDYIKFIRFAEHFIEKNGSGVVAMITNNSFLGGRIHRQMRKHLLETFDDIYIFNLHGNSNIQEEDPSGGIDENVFDIQQGVSINVFIRRNTEKENLGKINYFEIFGKREHKFETLDQNKIQNIKWKKLNFKEPYYFFVPKDFSREKEYKAGFQINELFIVNTSGVKTHHDNELVSFNNLDSEFNTRYLYRPFDYRFIDYDLKKVERHRFEVMKHVLNHNNISLITSNQFGGGKHFILLVSNIIHDISSQPYAAYYNFPLYLYSDGNTKRPNLRIEIVDRIEKIVGKVSPEDIFDYIYAVLHSPDYREKYSEFLKIDFPRVPYPKDKTTFKKLVKLGSKLRAIHLLESPKVNKFITTYPISGSDTVEKKPEYKDGKVYINDRQYFGNVPEVAWKFWIGGYQPAQKWLKDRRGRKLTDEDLRHYQKIIVALEETGRIMREINNQTK